METIPVFRCHYWNGDTHRTAPTRVLFSLGHQLIIHIRDRQGYELCDETEIRSDLCGDATPLDAYDTRAILTLTGIEAPRHPMRPPF